MWDVVVIGLGGVGSFALRAATQSAKQLQKHHSQKNATMKILGIEQFTPCHEFGSSHGHSRIYRHAYFEHSNYVPLIQYSTNQFRLLQQERNTRLLEECGTLILENANASIENNEDDAIIPKCIQSANQHNIKIDLLSNDDLQRKYPQFSRNAAMENMIGLIEYGAGFVRPELAIDAALKDAEKNGAMIYNCMNVHGIQEIVDNETKEKYVEIFLSSDCDYNNDPDDSTITNTTIKNKMNVIQSRKVIIAAGSWTSKLIPSWSPLLTVTRQIQAWVDVNSSISSTDSSPPNDKYHPDYFPTWFISSSSNNG